MTDWTLQDAKNSFTAIVDAALTGEPQRVSCDGASAVVVLSVDEYARLCDHQTTAAPIQDSASTQEAMPSFVDHLLAIPKGDPEDFEFKRIPLRPRGVEF